MSEDGFIRSVSTLAASLLALSAPLHAQEDAGPRTYVLDCRDSLSIDLKGNRSVCKNLAVSDGSTTLTADEGTANETNDVFQDSSWQLKGNVSIEFQTAKLSAENAALRFRANELVYAELSGSPVEMSDFIQEQNATIRGTAERIVYDSHGATLQLLGQATLALDANEYQGCDLIYNLNDKTFNSGSSECGVRVRVAPPPAGSDADTPTDP